MYDDDGDGFLDARLISRAFSSAGQLRPRSHAPRHAHIMLRTRRVLGFRASAAFAASLADDDIGFLAAAISTFERCQLRRYQA